jgi:hypothetical protein
MNSRDPLQCSGYIKDFQISIGKLHHIRDDSIF